MTYTCSRCFARNLGESDSQWWKMNQLGKNSKTKLEELKVPKEEYFKQEEGKKLFRRCKVCVRDVLDIKRNTKRKIRRINEKAAKGLDPDSENFDNDYIGNLVRGEVKRKTQQWDDKLDNVSGRLLQTEQNVAVCQSDIQELKNSDIERGEEIHVVQAKVDKKTEDIKQVNESVKKVEEENKQLKTQIVIWQEKTTKIWDKVFSKKETSHNIYDFDTIYHWIGWPIFLISAGYIIKKVRRARNKKIKKTKNYLAEIQAIFQEWQLNMYASTGAYVVGFYLIKEAIDKWINPRISGWLITRKAITIIIVSLLVGIGFYLDGLITSSLKTPLQRLGIKIENAAIDEKVKKSLLSKTQKVNELFKETLKRFGLLAVVGILTKLIAEFWNKDILTLLSYAVPIAGALKIIWEVDKTLKKLKLEK